MIHKIYRKILSAFVFFVALASLIQLVTMEYDPSVKIYEYFTISRDLRSGGGFIGGIFVMIFSACLIRLQPILF
jgi:hypothetical protein